MVPPEMVRSASAKSDDDSERVKVSDAVSPAFKEETSELTAMVGLTVSTVRVMDCQVSTFQKFFLPLGRGSLVALPSMSTL